MAPRSLSNHHPKPTTKSLSILVADDDEGVREIAMEFLRVRGHSVAGAADGRSALAAFERLKPDAVLLDQHMPGMDGLELARAIREKETQSRVHRRAMLIGLSGNVSPEDERRAREAGMDTLLSKPVGKEMLFRLIEQPAPRFSAAEISAAETNLRAHLTEITAGDQKFARKLVSGFLRDFPSKLAAVKRGILRKNADELASSAHALLGALGIFNAQNSLAAARNLESMGRKRQLQNASEAFHVLLSDLGRLERELREIFPQMAPRPKTRTISRNSRHSRTKR